MKNGIRVTDATTLPDYIGKTVEVTGRISEVPWQHIMNGDSEHPYDYYFDVGDFQIVIYAREKIACKGDLTVTGQVIELISGSKKTGEGDYREYHILVESFKCG